MCPRGPCTGLNLPLIMKIKLDACRRREEQAERESRSRAEEEETNIWPSPRLRFLFASHSSFASSTLLYFFHSNQRFVFPFFATKATLVVIKIRSTHTIKNCWKTSPLCAPSFSYCFSSSLCHLPRSFQLAQEYSKNTTHTHTCSLSLSPSAHCRTYYAMAERSAYLT